MLNYHSFSFDPFVPLDNFMPDTVAYRNLYSHGRFGGWFRLRAEANEAARQSSTWSFSRIALVKVTPKSGRE